MMAKLLEYSDRGIYCRQADVYIDPWKKVKKAFITHGHSDHARRGSSQYICVHESRNIIKHRLKTQNVNSIAFGEEMNINGVHFSFHPAGHIIGSAQIRVEYKGEVWVVSGDYKTENDKFSGNFESVACHTFITECTFGLPIFNWKPQEAIFSDINSWWEKNARENKISYLTAYSLGKAQRLISGLENGRIFTHSAVESMNQIIRDSGIALRKTELITPSHTEAELAGHLIIGPPSLMKSKYISDIRSIEYAAASGWMNVRRTSNRGSVNNGFILSDHADWKGLLQAIDSTGAERILVTHGYVKPFSKYLKEIGYDADILETEYDDENSETDNPR